MSDDTSTARRRRLGPRRLRWRNLPRTVRILVIASAALTLLAGIPFGWTRVAASGHLYDETDVPVSADVVLVLGAEVAPDGTQPMPYLRGRLDTAAQLARDGQARVILVSGDASGGSGNETSVMASYLTGVGVDAKRIVVDQYGLDTYDSCRRARDVFGLSRALVVTQGFHLARAVALCRHVGIDADGVRARCDACVSINLVRNTVRDYVACSKAAWDTIRDRPPAVQSPPSDAVTAALANA